MPGPLRFRDRSEAGRALTAPVRMLGLARPVLVGIGAGGYEVAVSLAETLPAGGAVARLDVAEIELGDPLHPNLPVGAIDSNGRTVFRLGSRPEVLMRSRRWRKAWATALLDLSGRARPSGNVPVGAVRDREALIVDDGSTTVTALLSALDLVRSERPSRIEFAVACLPEENLDALERAVGQVAVGMVPPWSDWHSWHGELYDSASAGT